MNQLARTRNCAPSDYREVAQHGCRQRGIEFEVKLLVHGLANLCSVRSNRIDPHLDRCSWRWSTSLCFAQEMARAQPCQRDRLPSGVRLGIVAGQADWIARRMGHRAAHCLIEIAAAYEHNVARQ